MELAARFPAAAEVLRFAGAVTRLQESLPLDPLEGWPPLRNLVFTAAPDVLRAEALALDEAGLGDALALFRSGVDVRSPRACFARILLQPSAACGGIASGQGPKLGRCPGCGRLPQAGILRKAGHGDALSLVCCLCFGEWPFARGVCPACGEADETKLSYFSAEALPHLRLSACESCHAYYHAIDLTLEPGAIADIDELAALPLDLWAAEQGYSKIQPSLAGI